MEEKGLLEEETILQAKPVIEETPSYQQEDELFQHYEINRFQLTPYFYKIVGASVILNAVFGLAMTQFNLTQNKACDSVYVSKVCSVIDAVYVGSQFFGTKTSTVDEPYDKTEFDTQDITWVDVSNKELFQYPPGYFYKEEEQIPPTVPGGDSFGIVNGGDSAKLTNPGAFQTPGNPLGSTTTTPNTTNPIAGNPTKSGSSLDINKPADLPKGGKQKSGLPDSPYTIGGNPIKGKNPDLKIISKSRNNPLMKDDPPKLPDDNDIAGNDKTKQPTPPNKLKSEKVDEVNINRRPLEDFGSYVNSVKEKVNLSSNFHVTALGMLNQNGVLINPDGKSPNPKLIEQSGDEQLINIAQQGVSAINASGYLKYLKMLSGKTLKLTFRQDDSNLTAIIDTDLENESKANGLSNAINLLIKGGIVKKNKDIADPENTNPQSDKDELVLLQNATVKSEGKKIVLQFAVPKTVASEIIIRNLDKLSKNKQTNSLEPKQTGMNLAK